MTITVYSVPKAMVPPFDTLQRNAVGSWTRLEGSEVLLFGNDAGVAELAEEVGATHIPEIPRTSQGTPLLDGVFSIAQARSSADRMVFVNADVVLFQDLVGAIDASARAFERFLAVGKRTTVDLGPLTFEGGWEALARRRASEGRLDPPDHLDWFAFPRGLFEEIPPFAVGRPPYDQWLIWAALNRGAAVVDATEAVLAIHQAHDYSHVPAGKPGAYRGGEAARNTELAGGWRRMLSLADATHVMAHDRSIRRAPMSQRIKSRLELTRRGVIDLTRPLRHLFGTRRGNLPDDGS